jgi:group I intron endonuclease
MESDNNIYYIYCISNNDDGKMYIGYTKDFEKRKKEHCRSKYYIGCAIRKYGKENFTFQKLLWFATEKEAKDTEMGMIRELHTLCPLGYNVHEGGSGGNTMIGASEEKIKERGKNISKGLAKMTSEEEALRRERIGARNRAARDKKSPQQKLLDNQRQSEGHKKRSLEQKLLESQRKSEAASGSNNPRYVHLAPEQELFIREQKKIGLGITKIPKTFFEKFDFKIGTTLIYRVLKS